MAFKTHTTDGHKTDDSHGNTRKPDKPDPDPPTVRKVPADSVPMGALITVNDEWVWAAYDKRDTLVCIATTAAEVRRKYKEVRRRG